jgi:hypothetical protein
MRTLTALVVMLACVTAQAKKKDPKAAPAAAPAPITPVTAPAPATVDPGKQHKLAGIITADIGVGLLVGGVIMLGISTTVNDDVAKRRALELAGGLCTSIGALGMVFGAVIWAISLRETKEWKASQKAWLIAPTFSRDGGGVALQLRF